MNVYVASAFQDFERTRAAHKALRDAGITVTHDWTQYVERYPNDDAPDAEKPVHAKEDVDGVRSADVVLVLTPEDKTRGAGVWIEMGAALALDIPVVIAGAQRDRNVFCRLALAQSRTDANAIETTIASCRALAAGIARRVKSGELKAKVGEEAMSPEEFRAVLAEHAKLHPPFRELAQRVFPNLKTAEDLEKVLSIVCEAADDVATEVERSACASIADAGIRRQDPPWAQDIARCIGEAIRSRGTP